MMVTEYLDWMAHDIETHQSSVPEFPVTSMSRALSQAIDILAKSQSSREAALDVGSGSGIHSFQLSELGFDRVQGIERSRSAVDLAEDRWKRFVERAENKPLVQPEFIIGTLEKADELPGLGNQFDLIVFNPPSFFTYNGMDKSSPLASGVYTGSPTQDSDLENPLLTFFKEIVAKRLAPGGRVISTWPGIQTRLVSSNPERSIMHPAEILSELLGWTIEGWQGQDPMRFYSQKSAMQYPWEELPRFRQLTSRYVESGDYSFLVKQSDPAFKWLTTFAFGVLVLERSTDGAQTDFKLLSCEDN